MPYLSVSACFVVNCSPVSDDSSICRSDDMTSVPSAGTSSPVSTSTTSPTTTSHRAMLTTTPPRRTLTGCSSPSDISSLNFLAASRSK